MNPICVHDAKTEKRSNGICRRKIVDPVNILKKLIGIFMLFLAFSANAGAEILVEDALAVKGREVMLRAKTGSLFFSKGGEIVEFFVNGKFIGSKLSGGDGAAYQPFLPKKAGLYSLKVKSGDDEDEGLMLCLAKGALIVFIDVEGSIMEKQRPGLERKSSRKTIDKIARKLPIVYLQTGLFGVKNLRKWLDEKDFKKAPVISWKEKDIFREAEKKGLVIKAVIGGPEVVESAAKHKPLTISFEPAKGSVKAGSWEEVERKLK